LLDPHFHLIGERKWVEKIEEKIEGQYKAQPSWSKEATGEE